MLKALGSLTYYVIINKGNYITVQTATLNHIKCVSKLKPDGRSEWSLPGAVSAG